MNNAIHGRHRSILRYVTHRATPLPLLMLALPCASPAWAQASNHFLARNTAAEYIVDTPLTADFVDAVAASGAKYRAFQQCPTVSNQTVKRRRAVSGRVQRLGQPHEP